MRTLILAGGLGSRLSEETVTKPKPMVEIGSDPILWHILKHYAHYGYDDFVIALGYRGELIKQYFTQYAALSGDLTVRTNGGVVERSAIRHDAGRLDPAPRRYGLRHRDRRPDAACGPSPR